MKYFVVGGLALLVLLLFQFNFNKLLIAEELLRYIIRTC